jgi:hypothetical protein
MEPWNHGRALPLISWIDYFFLRSSSCNNRRFLLLPPLTQIQSAQLDDRLC